MLEIIYFILLTFLRFLLLYCFICIFLSITRLRRKRFISRFVFKWYLSLILLVGVLLCSFQLRLSYSKLLNLNPSVTQEQLIGHWADKGDSLVLNSDGTFILRCHRILGGNRIYDGKWILFGNKLSLEIENEETNILRVITFDDKIRIIEEIKDGEGWANDFGYKKSNY